MLGAGGMDTDDPNRTHEAQGLGGTDSRNDPNPTQGVEAWLNESLDAVFSSSKVPQGDNLSASESSLEGNLPESDGLSAEYFNPPRFKPTEAVKTPCK